MRIIVTGGAGFIGSHLADAMLAGGHDVLVLDDLSTGRRQNVPSNAEFAELDIRNGAGVRTLFEKFKPHVVTHQAAQTSVSVSVREAIRDAEINVIGSINVLEACVASGTKKFVFASTGGAIYGEIPDGKVAGLDWPPAPQSPYACSKFAVEQYLRSYQVEHGIQSTVLRYANVYGPRQDPHGEAGVVAIFCERLLRGEPIRINARREVGDPGCVRDYVYVGQVVKANLLACEGNLGTSMINVSSGVPSTTIDLARAIEHEVGKPATIGFGPRRPGDVERSLLVADPILGAPVTLADGIAQTIRWFRDRS
jgi:UDP-glucose 4-epimerase